MVSSSTNGGEYPPFAPRCGPARASCPAVAVGPVAPGSSWKVGSWDGEELFFWDISLGTYKKTIENHDF